MIVNILTPLGVVLARNASPIPHAQLWHEDARNVATGTHLLPEGRVRSFEGYTLRHGRYELRQIAHGSQYFDMSSVDDKHSHSGSGVVEHAAA